MKRKNKNIIKGRSNHLSQKKEDTESSVNLECNLNSRISINNNIENSLSESNHIEPNSHSELLRTSAISKVNFSKLSENEKTERLKNQAKLVKHLKRKVRKLEKFTKKNINKGFKDYLALALSKTSNRNKNNKIKLTIENLSKALLTLKSNEEAEYDDQKYLIENLINLISRKRLKVGSFTFKKICTLLRVYLKEQKIEYIHPKGQNICYNLDNVKVNLSSEENYHYGNYVKDEKAMKCIFGIIEENNLINVNNIQSHLKNKNIINFDNPKEMEPDYLIKNSIVNNSLLKEEVIKSTDQFKNNNETKFINNSFRNPIVNNYTFLNDMNLTTFLDDIKQKRDANSLFNSIYFAFYFYIMIDSILFKQISQSLILQEFLMKNLKEPSK